jgi:hypothetical protein
MSNSAIRASRSRDAAAIAEKFGRSAKAPSIRWEGSSLVLERVSRDEAKRILAIHGKNAPPGSRFDTPDFRANVMAAAAAMSRGK